MNGYTADTSSHLLIGPAVVYRAGVPWATSRGGVRVERFQEIRQVEFDGRRAPVGGLDRVVSYGIRVTGTFLELNVTHAQRHEFGVTASVVGQVSTITTRGGDSAFFPSGAYVSDLLVVVERADNTLVGFRIPKVLVTYSIGGGDKAEVGIDTSFEARQDLTVVGVTSAPYTIEFDTSGAVVPPSSDANLALITALGGDANVAAAYFVRDGITGLKAASVIESAGVVSELRDYRGNVGYGPAIVFSGTARPFYDSTDKDITLDGTDDTGETAVSSVFDISGNKAIVFVGEYASGVNYVLSINPGSGGSTARWMAIAIDGGTWKVETAAFTAANSGVTANSTRRVVIASKNATTTNAIAVPNQAEVTGSPAASASGNNVLTLGRGLNTLSQFHGITFTSILVLNIKPDATQKNLIRDHGITHQGATAA